MLPNSKSTEEAFVWACIIDNSILNITKLEQEDFYDISLGKIFNLCKTLKDNRKNIDFIVLKDILEQKGKLDEIGGIMYLMELTESTQSWNWKDYEEIIKSKSERRKLIQEAHKIEMIARNESEALANAEDNCYTGSDFKVVREIAPTKNTIKGSGKAMKI